jgi:hypothetical protein
MSDKHNQILIAPCYFNKAGIDYEQEEITVLNLDATDVELGQQLINNFDSHKFKDQNLRYFKVSDWETLKISKSRSMNSFYEDYYFFLITGLAPDNHTLRIDAYPYKDSDITLNSTISRTRIAEIGNLIRRMFLICKSGLIK